MQIMAQPLQSQIANPKSQISNPMRRWIRRILLGLLLVILLVIATTQVVLLSDYPRRLVVGLVQRQLGLRVQATALSTGWFGHTTLRDVKLSLPLAEESFLEVPRMEVTHTWLAKLALTQNFELEGLSLQEPKLVVRQDSAGHWNIQDVVELVARATAG